MQAIAEGTLAAVQINELMIENFRCFEAETFLFPTPVTVLIGDNGTGKSALLDALAVAAGSLLLELAPRESRSITKSDIRLRRFSHEDVITVEPQPPSEVHCVG